MTIRTVTDIPGAEAALAGNSLEDDTRISVQNRVPNTDGGSSDGGAAVRSAIRNALHDAVRQGLQDGSSEVIAISRTLGKTTPGDQPPTSLTASFVWASGPYEATKSGELQSISLYTSQASGEVTLGVWLDDGGTIGELVAVSEVGTPVAGGWVTANASGNIVAGESYWIGWNFLENRSMGFDVAVNGTTKYKASAYSSGSLADPFPASPSIIGRRYPAYLTYLG